jgi:capsular exopolysaccharide synthesis family protein
MGATPVELTDYLRIARAYWRGIMALVLIGVALAAGYSLMQPRVYQADASGFVSAGESNNPAETSIGDTLAKSRATSYVDLAKSRATAQDVVTALKLTQSPSSLIGRISVTQPLDTVLIKISARAATPQEARRLADAWVAALARQVDAVENPSGDKVKSLSVVPIESAELPMLPISPNVQRNVGLGFVMGLLLGMGYAVLRSQLDRRVRAADVVEREFGVTVAGMIPETPALTRGTKRRIPLVMSGASRQADPVHSAEAFLKLRTNLQFMNIDKPPRVIVVTSPLPGDGKSTVALNLAAALSMSGQPAVLIDGDLRRPVVAESVGLVEGLGLTDVLIGRVGFEDAVQRVGGLPHLAVLAAGGVPPNPSELLGSNAMVRLLTRLSKDYIVIIDAPPLLPVTDAAVLTAAADGALVVVSSGRTLDTQLRDALGNLKAVNGHTLGVVLNRVPPRSSTSGYYGGYYGDSAKDQPVQRRQMPAPEPTDLPLAV